MIGAPSIRLSLGLVPSGARSVTPVPSHLKKLVPAPSGKNETVKENGADPVSDTVPMIKKLIRRQAWQGKQLAQALQGSTVEETLRNNWNFIFRHIQYVKDPDGRETVRSLRRLVYDGKGDCDCFVNALGNLLLNQRIPFKLRVARYHGADQWSHIYIIVPKATGGYYTLDPVVHQFNYEVSPTATKDFTMKLESLDGIGGQLDGLGCCGCGTQTQTMTSTATGSALMTTEKKPAATDYVPVKTLIARGYEITPDKLNAMGVDFTQNANGEYLVATATGPLTLPEMLSPEEATDLTNKLQAQAPTKTINNKQMWGWGALAAVIGLSMLPVSGGSSKAMNGVPSKKKRLAFAQL